MKKRIFSIMLTAVFLMLFFSSCKGELPTSSSIANSDILIIGSANESVNEYPIYNESVDFSDVSIPLTSEKESSSESSKNSTTSSKNSSTSSKNSSVKPSSSSKQSSVTTSAVTSVSSRPSSASSTTTSQTMSSSAEKRLNYETMKATWISYIDFADILTGKTETQFRKNFETVCKNSVNFGINTLFCQVRSFGDAIYKSEYFAWSQMASGVGKNPGYDPLEIMIEIAHKYNLSFHAWINPFRTFLPTQVGSVPDSTVFKKWYNDSSKKGKYIVLYGDEQKDERWYYNPGEPEVRELILNGVIEIIEKYKVDGIHFDDYFYPTTSATFDSNAYSKYAQGKTLGAWRRECVSSFVKSVYNAINKKNSNILFGISPQANIDNDMNQVYADVKLWSKNNGYLDYICPQVYFSYKSESLAFTQTINEWNTLVTASNLKLIIGMSPYRIGWTDTWACKDKSHTNQTVNCGKFGWQTDNVKSSNILERQATDSLSLAKCKGIALYSYKYLFDLDNYTESGYKSNAKAQAEIELGKLSQVLK